MADVLAREGKTEDALVAAQRISGRDLLRAWLEKRPASEMAEIVRESEQFAMGSRDAEPKYHIAGALAWSGYKKESLRVLRRAIEQNYCSYPAMDTDPYFASLRDTPEFAALRTLGIECQKKF